MSDKTKMIKKTKKIRKRLVIIDDKYAFRSKKSYWLCDDVWDIVKEYAGIYNLKINYDGINKMGLAPLCKVSSYFTLIVNLFNSNHLSLLIPFFAIKLNIIFFACFTLLLALVIRHLKFNR